MVAWLAMAAMAEDSVGWGRNVTLGDFDLDGFTDFVYGAATGGATTACGAGTGTVYVHYGDDPTTRWTVPGAAACGAGRGTAVAAGDVNGDGYDDLVVGSPGSELVQVHFGGAGGVGPVGATIGKRSTDGTNPDFGAALAAADFDCDGDDDVAVGLPNAAVRGLAGAGTVAVLNGGRAGLVDVGSRWSSETWSLDPAAAGDRFGARLAAARTGRCDPLAVGLPGRDVGGARDAGVVHVLFGSSAGIGTAARTRLTEASSTGRVVTAGRGLGASMAAASDLAGAPVLLVPVEEGVALAFELFDLGLTILPPVTPGIEGPCLDGYTWPSNQPCLRSPPPPGGDDCVECCGPGDCCIGGSCE